MKGIEKVVYRMNRIGKANNCFCDWNLEKLLQLYEEFENHGKESFETGGFRFELLPSGRIRVTSTISLFINKPKKLGGDE